MATNRVIILDPHDVTRHGWESLLRTHAPHLHIEGSFASLEACEKFLNSQSAQVLLVDEAAARTGDITHIVGRLHAHFPALRIVVLSRHLMVQYVEGLLAHGAAGFVYIEEQMESKLIRAVDTVLEGEMYLSPRAAVLSYSWKHDQGLEQLTYRDLEVVRWMREGLTARECAEQIGVDIAAVYRSRRKLRQILHVRTSEQIVEAAVRRGLFSD